MEETRSVGLSLLGSTYTIKGGTIRGCFRPPKCHLVSSIRMSITTGLQELEFTYSTSDSSSTNISSRGYVLLTEQQWFEEVSKPDKAFQRNLSNPFDELRYTILVLEWVQ